MKCIVCKQAATSPGTTTVTLERRGATFVFKDVPAQIAPTVVRTTSTIRWRTRC